MSMVIPDGILPSQQIGVETLYATLVDYLDTQERDKLNLVQINGGAGAGKSWTTTNSLIPTVLDTLKSDIKYRSISVVMTTTTHQANGVIAGELFNAGYSIGVSTIHSFLGLVPWSGTCTSNPPAFRDSGYRISDSCPNYNKVIIFIDEAYRICPNLWAIMQYLYPNALWIATYDAYQTPPVGYSSSPIDDVEAPKATLTESPRFANSGPLAQLVIDLRKCVENNSSDYLAVFEGYKDKAYTEAVGKDYGKYIREAVAKNEPLPKDVLMVCGTRKGAAKYNMNIHKLRKNSGQDIFQDGDPITVEYVLGIQETNIVINLRRDREWMDSFQPVNPKTTKYDFFKQFKYLYQYKESKTFIAPIFAPDEKLPFKMYKAAAKAGITIIGVRLNYARTVHTAQGMTVPNVFIDMGSILAWSSHDMRRRLLYTGASRCSGVLKVVE